MNKKLFYDSAIDLYRDYEDMETNPFTDNWANRKEKRHTQTRSTRQENNKQRGSKSVQKDEYAAELSQHQIQRNTSEKHSLFGCILQTCQFQSSASRNMRYLGAH